MDCLNVFVGFSSKRELKTNLPGEDPFNGRTALGSKLPMNQADTSLTAFLSGKRTAPPVRFLAEVESLAVFTLNAYLEEERGWDGPTLHHALDDWLRSERSGEDGLKEWLQEKVSPKSFQPSRFDRSEKQARRWLQAGFAAAALPSEVPGLAVAGAPACPRMLFGSGHLSSDHSCAAVFNSRKSRLPDPHAEWLEALRHCLASIAAAGAGLAGSLGTLTYDLATAHARQHRYRLLLVLPSSVEEILSGRFPIPLAEAPPPDLVLTCHTGAMNCSKATRAVCRDRLLAFLADVHLVIEVRLNGNLGRVLYDQQKRDPRRQAIFQPKRLGTWNAGNLQLQAAFPEWALPFSTTPPDDSHDGAARTYSPPSPDAFVEPVLWEKYLYHYSTLR